MKFEVPAPTLRRTLVQISRLVQATTHITITAADDALTLHFAGMGSGGMLRVAARVVTAGTVTCSLARLRSASAGRGVLTGATGDGGLALGETIVPGLLGLTTRSITTPSGRGLSVSALEIADVQRRVLPMVAGTGTLGPVTAVELTGDQRQRTWCATDRYHLAMLDVVGPCPEPRLVPAKLLRAADPTLDAVLRFGKVVTITQGPNYLWVVPVGGSYPAWRPLLDGIVPTTVVEQADLAAAFAAGRRAGPFGELELRSEESPDGSTALTIGEGRLEGPWHTEIASDGVGKWERRFLAAQLHRIVRAAGPGQLAIGLSPGPVQPVEFRGANGWRALIMPLRVPAA